MSNYSLHEKPRNWKDAIGYTLQFVFAVLTATILISTICGTSIAAGLVAAGIGTICFLLITGFKAPIVISNSGATVSAVIGAIALSGAVEKNFTGVILGGAVIAIIYSCAALAIKRWGVKWLYGLIPPLIAGTTIIVIGANLATFIPTYALVAGSYSLWGILVAVITALTVVICAHYGKGLIRTLPFLLGLLVGYIVSFILTLCGVPLVDMSQLAWKGIISIPDFAFLHVNFATFDWSTLPQIILSFGMVSLAALTEHIGDMTTASAVTGYHLISDPGLHRTLIGDGVGSLLGTIIGAQPNTTYSEYTSTMSVSGVYSSWFTLYTAITLIALGFIAPFNQFLMALPNAVFAGVSIIAYGMIAMAGLRTIIDANINFNIPKNQFVFAAMLTTGVSGLAITAGAFNLTGIALSMITGVILNLILKDKADLTMVRKTPRFRKLPKGPYAKDEIKEEDE